MSVFIDNLRLIESNIVLFNATHRAFNICVYDGLEFLGNIEVQIVNSPVENYNTIRVENGINSIIVKGINLVMNNGCGTLEPIKIGTHNGKAVFMHIWFFSHANGTMYKADYNLFMEN